VAAAVAALPFWIGVYLVLHEAAEILTHKGFDYHPYNWAIPVAAVVTGAIYIPLSLYMRTLSRQSSVEGPRRAFVLALLAAGILATAIGGGIALVTTLTALLGQPLDPSGGSTRAGVAALLTGLALAALYGWTAVSERLVAVPTIQPAGGAAPSQGDGSESQPGLSVEAVLDELLAGTITRDEAARRVRAAARAGR
jgi:hypothetical protein